MKTILVWMLVLAVAFLPIAGISAETTNCTETLPEIFQRVSKTVVLITAVSLNHFSMTERPVLSWDLPPGESFYAIPWSGQQR